MNKKVLLEIKQLQKIAGVLKEKMEGSYPERTRDDAEAEFREEIDFIEQQFGEAEGFEIYGNEDEENFEADYTVEHTNKLGISSNWNLKLNSTYGAYEVEEEEEFPWFEYWITVDFISAQNDNGVEYEPMSDNYSWEIRSSPILDEIIQGLTKMKYKKLGK
jgi:hypothetical protein